MLIDANLRSKKFLLGHCYQVSKERILCLLPFSSLLFEFYLYLPSHSSCYRWLSVKHETVWLKKSFNWFLGGKKQLLPTSITSINTLGLLVFSWSDLYCTNKILLIRFYSPIAPSGPSLLKIFFKQMTTSILTLANEHKYLKVLVWNE